MPCTSHNTRYLLAVVVVALAAGTARGEFEPLLNGIDLEGWHVVGGDAIFSVDSGEVVGTSVPNSPNTFLVTDQPYADYQLELEFRIADAAFNSGVQIRSDTIANHNNGQLFGYQVEIDPSSRAWSGGLYFEGGSPTRPAGWLADLSGNPSAQAAFELGAWNHFRIIAQGRRLTTWINDVLAVDFFDFDEQSFLPSGVIGLQVHANESPTPLEVRWRNVQIDVLEPGQYQTLGDFNNDGTLDLDDYLTLSANMHANSSQLSPAEAYLLGDITGDRVINYNDFTMFRDIYSQHLGVNAFGIEAAMLYSVPEAPAWQLTLVVTLTGMAILQFTDRKTTP